MSRQAEAILAKEHNLKVQIIDLHWLHPLPTAQVADAIKTSDHVLVVDECRQTGSLSETLIAELNDSTDTLPTIARHCAKDSFIPLGNSWQYLLPSQASIVAAAVELCNNRASLAQQVNQ